MEVVANNIMPGDSRLVEQLVYELKSQGIFDRFRKECISDVDTKPAYQNLRQRVEGSVSNFLRQQTWSPDMNKNQVREQLRKNIYESGYLEAGVERIVDQVVNPKINTIFLPEVEDVVYRFLGIVKPARDIKKEVKINIADLLPTDLEAVSPESVHSFRDDVKPEENIETLNDSLNSGSKPDEDESPPFEPLDLANKIANEENSVDSHLSGFSGLQSHGSNHSGDIKVCQMEISNQDSQVSHNSSESRLSIITSEDTTKMDICDDSSSNLMKSITNKTITDTMIETKMDIDEIIPCDEANNSHIGDITMDESHGLIVNVKENESSSDNIYKVDKSENDESGDKKSEKMDEKRTDKHDRSLEKKSKSSDRYSKDKRDDKNRKSSSSSKDVSSSKHSSSTSKEKDRDRSRKDSKSSSSTKDKERTEKNREKTDRDKEKKDKGRDKSEKEKTNREKERDVEKSAKDKEKTDKDKVDKDRSARDKPKEKSEKEKSDKDKAKSEKSSKDKEKSSKDKEKSTKDKDRDKSDKEKERSDKEKSNKEKERSDKEKDRAHRDKDKSSKDKDKSAKPKERSDKEKGDKHKEKYREKDKYSKEKSSKEKENLDKEKSSESKTSSKDKTDRPSSSSKKEHSDREKSRSSNSNSSKDKSKLGNGESKSRSSTDKSRKDSKHSVNGKSSSGSSESKKDKDKKQDSKKQLKDDHYSSKDKKNDRRSTDRDSNDGHSNKPNFSGPFSENNSSRSEKSSQDFTSNSGSGDSGNSDQVEQSEPIEHQEAAPVVCDVQRLIMPKFASNFQEIRKIMKIRKQLALLEKQKRLGFTHIESQVLVENGLPKGKPKRPAKQKKPAKKQSYEKRKTHVQGKENVQRKADIEENVGLGESLEIICEEVVDDSGAVEAEISLEQSTDETRVETPESPWDSTSLRSTELSQENWEALEARLAQEMSTVNCNSYESDEEMHHSAGPKRNEPAVVSKTVALAVAKTVAVPESVAVKLYEPVAVEMYDTVTVEISDTMAEVEGFDTSSSSNESEGFKGFPKEEDTNSSLVFLKNFISESVRRNPTIAEGYSAQKSLQGEVEYEVQEQNNGNRQLSVVINKNELRKNKRREQLEEACYFLEESTAFEGENLRFLREFVGKLEGDLLVFSMAGRNNAQPVKRGRKRKLEEIVDVKNNNRDHYEQIIARKRGRPPGSQTVLTKDNKEKLCNTTDLLTHEKFSLPLSPAESDKSSDKKDEELLIPAKRRRIIAAQRYSSEDLYKPRPVFCRRNKDAKKC